MRTPFRAISLFFLTIIAFMLIGSATNLFALDDDLELTDDDFSKERIAQLTLALEDKDAATWGASVEKLSLLGAEARPAIPKMLTLLVDQEQYRLYSHPHTVGGDVTECLPKLSPECLLALQKRFPNLPKQTQLDVALRIMAAGPSARALLPDLLQLFEDSKTDARSRPLLLTAISAIDPNGKQALPKLLKALRHDKDEDVRNFAAISLSRTKYLTQVYWKQEGPAGRWFRAGNGTGPQGALEHQTIPIGSSLLQVLPRPRILNSISSLVRSGGRCG